MNNKIPAKTNIMGLTKEVSAGISVRVGKLLEIGDGLDGTIYEEIGTSAAIKIYKDVNKSKSASRLSKISAMIESTPKGVIANDGGKSYVRLGWPRAIIRNNISQFVGFEMPLVDASGAVDLYHILKPKDRKLRHINNAFGHRIAVAYNLAVVVNNLHVVGHHIIDLKPDNAKIYTSSAFVVILDCDGFSIKSKSGQRFATETGTPGYLAPETVGNPHRLDEFQDRFALGIIIFQLLNEGLHPFSGVPKKGYQVPDPNQDRIDAQLYPCGLNPNPRLAPHQQSLHHWFEDETRALFDRAFSNRSIRPSAEEWCRHLKTLMPGGANAIRRCVHGSHHLVTSKGCAHCSVAALTGYEPGTSRVIPKSAGNLAQQPVTQIATHPTLATPLHLTPSQSSQTGIATTAMQAQRVRGTSNSTYVPITIAGLIVALIVGLQFDWSEPVAIKSAEKPKSQPTVPNPEPRVQNGKVQGGKIIFDQIPSDQSSIADQEIVPPNDTVKNEVVCTKPFDMRDGFEVSFSDGRSMLHSGTGTILAKIETRRNNTEAELIEMTAYRGFFPLSYKRWSNNKKQTEYTFAYNVELSSFFPIRPNTRLNFTMMQTDKSGQPVSFVSKVSTGQKKEMMIGECSYEVVEVFYESKAKSGNGAQIAVNETSLYSNALGFTVQSSSNTLLDGKVAKSEKFFAESIHVR